jgi:beta-glucosidase
MKTTSILFFILTLSISTIFAQKPSQITNTAPMLNISSAVGVNCNITLYQPFGLRVQISEKRPDYIPDNFLCVPAAYTTISTQIEGLYINKGIEVNSSINTRLTGACILSNESIQIIEYKDITQELINEIKQANKSFFQQSLLVKDSQIVLCDLFGRKTNLRRALIQFKNAYCIGESSIPVTIDEFQESLLKIGAVSAVNLDMGTWSEGWYKNQDNERIRIGEKMISTQKQTNWIVYSKSSFQNQYPFQDPKLPVEKRIDNILSLLTLDEKVNCLGTNPTVDRLGLKGTGHVEGLHGLAMGLPGSWGRKTPVPTTTFPQSIGMAETWDPELLKQAAEIEAYETRYLFQSEKYRKGGLVVRAPNADLGRDPRWGRTEECYGEDAYFNGTMAVAYIKGLQGNDPTYWTTAALMKHFLANSNENGRDSSSSNFDERLFREYYSVPFRMGVIEGGSRAYMASYNKVNGIPQTVNPMLINVTVDEWGQNGIICTDGGAYKMLITAHKYYPSPAEAAAACIKAGINQFLDTHKPGTLEALNKNLISEADIDKVLRGVFRVMIKLGQLDPPQMDPYASIGTGPEPWLSQKHRDFARLITQKSIVLLKNNGILPLDKNKIKSIAVVGPRSAEVYQDWYSGTPPYAVSPLEGIKNKLGQGIVITHTTNNDMAVTLAKSAETVIICVGNNPTGNLGWKKVDGPSEGREAVDREKISLEPSQQDLIERVYKVNPNVVVVMISSFPYTINWVQENIPSIIHITHSGQEEGNALADALFGDINPGGRLVQTWPDSLSQLPPMMDYNIRNGRTYMYFKAKPLYPFGFGLSYTTFKYTNFKTSAAKLDRNGEITVSIDITNTGSRPGDEVVQLYVRHIGSKVDRPDKELKGFQRITLKANETRTVTIPVKAESLAFWDIKLKKFVVEKDKIQILIGSSSANIKADQMITIN